MGDYYGICKKCGHITHLGSHIPNEYLNYSNGSQQLCEYCDHPMISMDKTIEEYREQYKELVGTYPTSTHDDLIPFMETTFIREHANDWWDPFDPAAKEARLQKQAEEKRILEERERDEARKKYVREIASIPRCPKCGSKSIATRRNALTLNPNGFINVCQNCGKKWKPKG